MHSIRFSSPLARFVASTSLVVALGVVAMACQGKDKSTTKGAVDASAKSAKSAPLKPETGSKTASASKKKASPTTASAEANKGAPAMKPGDERWQGLIDLGMKKVEVLVDLRPGISGWTATLGLPGSKIYGIALKDVNYDDKRLTFTLFKPAAPKASESYILDREGPTAGSGTVTISGQAYPWSATKLAANSKVKALLRRPQTPKPPFPYLTRELVVTNAADGVKRAGTLSLPKGAGPFPVVIIESGSGAQDRDGTFSGHKSYLVIADYLARNGIAAFRTDDRGVGGSTGVDADANHETFAADVVAMAAMLKTQPGIDPKRIGVIGHSQGATVGPLAATLSGDITFVVMLAGIGVPGDQVMMDQKRLIMESHRTPPKRVVASMKAQRAMLDGILNDADAETLRGLVASSVAADVAPAQLVLLTPARQAKIVDAAVKSLQSGFLRALVKSKPATYLSKVKVPTLAIWGARDLQVEPKSNSEGVRKIFEASGHKAFEILIVDDMSHNLQETKTGKVEEIATIEESVRPVLLKKLVSWIGTATAKPTP